MQEKLHLYSKHPKNARSLIALLVLVILATTLAASCATKLPPIPDEISSAELIQKAQDRSDVNDWKGAQYYYRALQSKFPDDPKLMVTAMYELAFIEYKQEHWSAARAGLEAVLARYESEDADTLPQTWKILAEKVIAKIPAKAAKGAVGAATTTTTTTVAPAASATN